MKTTILRMIMLSTLAVTLTFAQGKRGGGMMKDLNLTPEQKPQVESIMKEQRAAMQSARQNNASREELKAIRQKTSEKLSSVLNAEQMQKFQAAAKQRRHKGAPKA